MPSALFEFLNDPKSYPDPVTRVELVETHISQVFLTDKYAYKLKKPVRFQFLDFSTLELRLQACRDELRLNRRLATGVYLEVEAITEQHGKLQFGGSGRPVDYVVKMRRLPDELCLRNLLLNRQFEPAQATRLAERLADFYQGLDPASIEPEDYRRQLVDHVLANRDELERPEHGLDSASVRRVHSAQLRMLRLFPRAFYERVVAGRIVEGHGDLRPEHIYLLPEPQIIDCIEFNLEFRRLDIIDELSFLAEECTRLGAQTIGGQVLQVYCDRTGDIPRRQLVPFFHSYRACVRAKVEALRHAQSPQTGDSRSFVAAEYLRLADQYAREIGSPMLLVVRGLSGSGKSTLATAIAQQLGMELHSTDQIRIEMFGQSPQKVMAEPSLGFDAGRYSSDNRLAVYDEMFRRAATHLANGLSVILDGTFLTTKLRMESALLARRFEAIPVLMHCRCPDEVARHRIVQRLQQVGSNSEAWPEILSYQRDREESDAAGIVSCTIETAESLTSVIPRALQQLGNVVFPQVELVA